MLQIKKEKNDSEVDSAWKEFDELRSSSVEKFKQFNPDSYYNNKKGGQNGTSHFRDSLAEVGLGSNDNNNNNNNEIKDDSIEALLYYGLSATKENEARKEKMELIKTWNERRLKLYSLLLKDKKTQNHSCSMDCINNEYTQKISEKYKLYGCIKGGYTHECRSDRATCKFTFISKEDGLIVCVLSKSIIGPLIESRVYGKTEKGVDQLSSKGGKFTRKRKAVGGEGRSCGGGGEESDNESYNDYGDEEDASSFSVGDNSNAIEDYDYYNYSFNEGGGEEYNGDKNENVGEGLSKDDSAKKKRDGTADSLLEGRDKYESEESGTANSKKKKARRCFNQDYSVLVPEVKGIIYDILYNNESRKRISEKRMKDLKKSAEIAVQRYYKECNKENEMVILHTVDSLYDYHKTLKRSLSVLVYSKERVDYYTEIIIRLWRIMLRSPFFKSHKSKFHLKQHVLASLFLMKDGFSGPMIVDGAQGNERMVHILEKDKFLEENMPLESDLKDIKSLRSCYNHGAPASHTNNTTSSSSSKPPSTDVSQLDPVSSGGPEETIAEKGEEEHNSSSNNNNNSNSKNRAGMNNVIHPKGYKKNNTSTVKSYYSKGDITSGTKNIKMSINSFTEKGLFNLENIKDNIYGKSESILDSLLID